MINNDFYAEYLVQRQSSGADAAKKAGVLILTFLVAVALILFFGPMGLMMAALAVYGGWYFMQGLDIEYEYIVSNGEMDVDKVIGRRKRKRLVTADLEEVTAFGPLKEAPEEPDNCTTVLASDNTGEGTFFMDFKHKSAGNVRIIFTPSEKILDGMEIFLPRQLRIEFKRNRAGYSVKKGENGAE